MIKPGTPKPKSLNGRTASSIKSKVEIDSNPDFFKPLADQLEELIEGNAVKNQPYPGGTVRRRLTKSRLKL